MVDCLDPAARIAPPSPGLGSSMANPIHQYYPLLVEDSKTLRNDDDED